MPPVVVDHRDIYASLDGETIMVGSENRESTQERELPSADRARGILRKIRAQLRVTQACALAGTQTQGWAASCLARRAGCGDDDGRATNSGHS